MPLLMQMFDYMMMNPKHSYEPPPPLTRMEEIEPELESTQSKKKEWENTVIPQIVKEEFDYTSIECYEESERADELLKKHFPTEITPEENFFKALNFLCNFYYDLLQLPIQMGEASNRCYQSYLGDIQAKRMRLEIAGNENYRNNVIALGREELKYFEDDFKQCITDESKFGVLHKIALHIAVLRSHKCDVSDGLKLLTEDDPLIDLFAVLELRDGGNPGTNESVKSNEYQNKQYK